MSASWINTFCLGARKDRHPTCAAVLGAAVAARLCQVCVILLLRAPATHFTNGDIKLCQLLEELQGHEAIPVRPRRESRGSPCLCSLRCGYPLPQSLCVPWLLSGEHWVAAQKDLRGLWVLMCWMVARRECCIRLLPDSHTLSLTSWFPNSESHDCWFPTLNLQRLCRSPSVNQLLPLAQTGWPPSPTSSLNEFTPAHTRPQDF